MGPSLEFSIIIPTYNRLEFLKQALNSVWAQSYSNYEIIVVNDGSTDGTRDYLSRLGGRVKALFQPNKGPGAARNFGVKQAVGAYVAFLDSDDIWFPWTLCTFHKLIRRHQQPSLLCGAVYEFDGDLPDVEEGRLTAGYFRDYLGSANDPGFVGSGALVAKREIFENVGGFDESMMVAEDHDLCFRLGVCRGFVKVRSPLTLAYRRHIESISTLPLERYTAAMELLIRESTGRYPGGKVREKERWQLLGRMLRPVAIWCLRAGFSAAAWRLYRRSFRMNARLGRFRFLAGFALYSVYFSMKHERPIHSSVLPARAKP